MPPTATAKTANEKLAKIASLVRHPEIRRTRIKREVLEAITELTEDVDPADDEATPDLPSASPAPEPEPAADVEEPPSEASPDPEAG